MENLKEVARLILLQVDHNRECGKDDKFTLEEITDIIDRRVVKLFLIPPVIGQLPPSDITNKEWKNLMKQLYPKDRGNNNRR